MHCPACGGQLVWENGEGYVVCSSCGLVLDRIFDESTISPKEEAIAHKKGRGKEKRRSIFNKEYAEMLRLYKKGLKLVKERPWLEVDYEKVFIEKRFVKAIMSRASAEALEDIDRHNYWDIVNEGMRVIAEANPALLSRSARGSYALAYMISVKLRTGRFPDMEEVTKVFHISPSTYARYKKIVMWVLKRGVERVESIITR